MGAITSIGMNGTNNMCWHAWEQEPVLARMATITSVDLLPHAPRAKLAQTQPERNIPSTMHLLQQSVVGSPDSTRQRIYGGASEIMKEIVARSL